MAAKRTSLQEPALTLQEKIGRTLRQSAMLRRLKRALPNAYREHLSYGPDKYLPQVEHFLALLKAGARESDVVPLELSLDIQRVVRLARADHGDEIRI